MKVGESGRNPLVEMLARNAQRLPDWLGLVVTSRPEFDFKTPLQALNPVPLDTQPESNRADIRNYLRRELAAQLQSRPDGLFFLKCLEADDARLPVWSPAFTRSGEGVSVRERSWFERRKFFFLHVRPAAAGTPNSKPQAA